MRGIRTLCPYTYRDSRRFCWKFANEVTMHVAQMQRRPLCQRSDQLQLDFSTNVEVAIKEAEMIFLCIDTPTKPTGPGEGFALDTTNLQAAVRTIARVAKTDKIIVEISTVPCGTASTLRDLVCLSHLPAVLGFFTVADILILTLFFCLAESRS